MQTLPMNVAARCAYIPTHTRTHTYQSHIAQQHINWRNFYRTQRCFLSKKPENAIYYLPDTKRKSMQLSPEIAKRAFENLILFMNF